VLVLMMLVISIDSFDTDRLVTDGEQRQRPPSGGVTGRLNPEPQT
jgi:hypothetical protein